MGKKSKKRKLEKLAARYIILQGKVFTKSERCREDPFGGSRRAEIHGKNKGHYGTPLYRGLRGADVFVRFSNSAIGAIYQEHALTSSSAKRNVAWRFSGKGSIKNNGVLIKFDGGIPKGATSVQGISHSEDEVLFSGKNQYKIIKKEYRKVKQSDKYETLIVTVKYIGREDEKA